MSRFLSPFFSSVPSFDLLDSQKPEAEKQGDQTKTQVKKGMLQASDVGANQARVYVSP